MWDVDGNEYVDFPMALGPIILGYAEPAVDEAVRRQLADGITFTLMHPLEVEVAERIVAMCPGVEAVRFAKSGSDALSGAVRAARAYTGRDHVLVGGYHGWHDWYIGTTTRDRGVPGVTRQLTTAFPYGDRESLELVLDQHRDQVAAVILEPSGATVPDARLPAAVVDAAHRHGALCVFDEIITGFRLAPGGARPALRRDPGPGLLRQGAGQRHAGVGRGRVLGAHGRVRGGLLLRHPRRRGLVAGRGPGGARHAGRRNRPGPDRAAGPARCSMASAT